MKFLRQLVELRLEIRGGGFGNLQVILQGVHQSSEDGDGIGQRGNGDHGILHI